VSFNTLEPWSGIALQGEVSHRLDAPLQVDDLELLFATLGGLNPGLAAGNQVGNFLAPKPEIPDINNLPSIQALRERASSTTSGLGEIDPDLLEAIEHDIDQVEGEEDREFRNRWKSARPQSDITNDSVFQREWQKHKDNQKQRRIGITAKARFDFMSTQLQASELDGIGGQG